ncbi:MAG: GNAT family N-acetyltransferase [bacterium]
MNPQPTLHTSRLILRPFQLEDAPMVQKLAGDKDVASTTLTIPHPYEDGMAEKWIKTRTIDYEKGERITFAITHKSSLIGAINLRNDEHIHQCAEIGYWIGKPYWKNGFCTEAALALLCYGFQELGLNRIYATHFVRNPASGRVMQKIGMKKEGVLRQSVQKWGVFEDQVLYGILKSEFESAQK